MPSWFILSETYHACICLCSVSPLQLVAPHQEAASTLPQKGDPCWPSYSYHVLQAHIVTCFSFMKLRVLGFQPLACRFLFPLTFLCVAGGQVDKTCSGACVGGVFYDPDCEKCQALLQPTVRVANLPLHRIPIDLSRRERCNIIGGWVWLTAPGHPAPSLLCRPCWCSPPPLVAVLKYMLLIRCASCMAVRSAGRLPKAEAPTTCGGGGAREGEGERWHRQSPSGQQKQWQEQ